MTDAAKKSHADFVLPPSVVSRVDVSRLVSELERVDNEMTAARVRAGLQEGSEGSVSVVISQAATDFLAENELTLDDGRARSELVKQLRALKDKVPIIHMTFAVTADRESLGKIVAWLRETVHPQAVIAVGLQPALVAGVYLRTSNHVHDLSLRAKLQGSHDVLVGQLEDLRGGR